MSKLLSLLILSVVSLIGCNNLSSQGKLSQRPETQALLDSLVLANNIPGVNFSIILPDGSSESYSSGYEDIEKEVLLTSDKVLFSGSVGKTYAVAILFQLIDKGEVSLSDKIIDYFPEIDWMTELPNINDITIKMLLQHTTGLPRWVMGPEVWEELQNNPNKVWTYKDRFSYVFGMDPVHPANEGWGYSDTNYLLVGMLIEKITGQDYYDLVESRIIEPMKLERTYPSLIRNIPNLSQGYSRLPEFFKCPDKVVSDDKYFFNPQMEWTGGGMASSSYDLARWADIYYSSTLFSDSLLARIMAKKEGVISLGPGTSYTMGSFLFETPNGIAYGHTGFVPGFNAIFAYYPENDLAVAMLFNSDFAGASLPLNTYLDIVVKNYTQE